MILDYLGDLNWVAVLVATAAYFAVGAIWYSNALFGKQYRAAIGAEEGGSPEVAPMVVNFIGWFVAATVLALLVAAVGADDWVDGLVLGLVAWLGFIGTNRVVANLYEGRGWDLSRINGPYNALGYAAMGVILAIWQ